MAQELVVDKAAAYADLQQHVGSLRYLHGLKVDLVTKMAATPPGGRHPGRLVAGCTGLLIWIWCVFTDISDWVGGTGHFLVQDSKPLPGLLPSLSRGLR